MLAGRSFADALVQHDGRPSGFDYLRLLLSIGVIAVHTVVVQYGLEADRAMFAGPARPIIYLILPCFFALSGFLVAGSLDRNNVPNFLTLRAIRIFPALSAEVLLSAFILGPLFTSLALGEYFTDPKFFIYFLNAIGIIQYELPGVFLDNPFAVTVNAQLWTVPYELECYIALAALAILRFHRHPSAFLALLVLICLAGGVHAYFVENENFSNKHATGRILVISFLFGVVLYGLRQRIPHHPALAVLAFVLCCVFVWNEPLSYFIPATAAYLTIYVGLLNPKRVGPLKGADYSYGMYLYGFPVQQSVTHVTGGLLPWWVHLPLSLAITCVFAAFSWHVIESRVMDQKKRVIRVSDRFAQRLPPWIRVPPLNADRAKS